LMDPVKKQQAQPWTSRRAMRSFKNYSLSGHDEQRKNLYVRQKWKRGKQSGLTCKNPDTAGGPFIKTGAIPPETDKKKRMGLALGVKFAKRGGPGRRLVDDL